LDPLISYVPLNQGANYFSFKIGTTIIPIMCQEKSFARVLFKKINGPPCPQRPPKKQNLFNSIYYTMAAINFIDNRFPIILNTIKSAPTAEEQMNDN
jgi:hypothetical protein